MSRSPRRRPYTARAPFLIARLPAGFFSITVNQKLKLFPRPESGKGPSERRVEEREQGLPMPFGSGRVVDWRIAEDPPVFGL